jgi:hypothetical protein
MRMTRTWFFVLLAILFFATACTSETEYGDCLGIDDVSKMDPKLEYDVDVGNIVVAVIFSETIIVPVYVALEEVWCPVGKKGE